MKILVIANNILRKVSPASSIENSLLEGLASEGFKITTYCSSLGELYNRSDAYRTILIKERIIWVYFCKIVRKVFPDLMYIPDFHYFSWGLKTQWTAIRDVKRNHYGCIHSFSHASSNHLIAYYLHRKSGLPWIATFYDSWTDYPELKYKTQLFRKYNQNLERLVAESANIIVHNNENIANLWRKRYGEVVKNKIFVIPLTESFEGLREPTSIEKKSNILVISHIGTFYPFRDASSFIEGVRLFVEENPHYRNNIHINFIGKTLVSDLKKIVDYKLDDIISILGRMSQYECEEYYLSSDIFLATAMAPFEDITYPSKILKYFFYRKPILGICPDSSVLSSELEMAGHRHYRPDDSQGIADYLLCAVDNYENLCSFDINYWKKFTKEKIVGEYKELIETLVTNIK